MKIKQLEPIGCFGGKCDGWNQCQAGNKKTYCPILGDTFEKVIDTMIKELELVEGLLDEND